MPISAGGLASSILTAVVAAWLTSVLTRRRDRESDWRRLRFDVYKEFILALSGIVEGREDRAAHLRYADATNSMQLIAPVTVLNALSDFLRETSEKNTHRSDDEHNRLLDLLVKAMREDVHPALRHGRVNHPFGFRTIPTAWQAAER